MDNRIRIVLACAVELVAFVCPALSATYYVSNTGGNIAPYTNWAIAATNIATVLGLGVNGDSIYVTNGYYLLSVPLALTSSVMLKSVNGANDTVIDGNKAFCCVSLYNTGAYVDGFTICNGSNGNGGGVYFTNGGTIARCVITANMARNGGGIYFGAAGAAVDTVIQCNTSMYDGGGCYMNDGGAITNCRVLKNVTISSGMGGGGGCAVYYNGRIASSLIESNYSAGPAGGVASYHYVYIDRSIIRGNSHYGAAHYYGGPYVYNTLYERNMSSGVYFEGSIHYYNCTFSGNNGYAMEADLYLHGSSVPGTIMNCIFYPENTHIVAYSVTQPAFSNNYYLDPGFVDMQNGDYRLSAQSLCLDGGVYDYWMTNALDLYGAPRIVGNAADIGAYEYYGSDGVVVAQSNVHYATWNVVSDRTYSVEMAADLLGLWSAIGTEAMATSNVLSVQFGEIYSNGYYRIRYIHQ